MVFFSGFEKWVIFVVYVKQLIILYCMYLIFKFRRVKNSVVFAVLFAFSRMFIYWSNQYSNFTGIVFITLQVLGYETYRYSNKKFWFIVLWLPIWLFSFYYAIIGTLFMMVYML